MNQIQRYEAQLPALTQPDPQDVAVQVWQQLPTELKTNEHWVELYQLAATGQWAELQDIAQQARSLTITDSRQYHHTDNRRYTYTDNRKYSKATHAHSHLHASGFWIATLIAVVVSALVLSLPNRMPSHMEPQNNDAQNQPQELQPRIDQYPATTTTYTDEH